MNKINRGLITQAIRDSAFVQVSKRKKVHLNVSPEFIDEYIDRIFVGIEVNIQQISKRVYNSGKGRKTLTVKYDKDRKTKDSIPVVDDVTQHFGYTSSSTIDINDSI